MINSEPEMLRFYKDHGIIPVRQDIRDLDVHLSRRRILYQQLGIPTSSFSKRRVLEIGPGTGQNALYIVASGPSELVLVEPNPASVESIQQLCQEFSLFNERVTLKPVMVEQFTDPQRFDIVLCEGLVGASGSSHPNVLLESISKHVKIGGILVITCADYVSYFSEQLRRLLAIDMTKHLTNLIEKTAYLAKIFRPHLQKLSGMSRGVDDWVMDNLLNPASIGHLLGFADCVGLLSKNFEIMATSPRFITDWTWYKRAVIEENFFNRTALDSYWCNLHNFMDWRYRFSERSREENMALMESCERIHHKIREYEQTLNPKTRQVILTEISCLRDLVLPSMAPVKEALDEIISWLAVPVIDPEIVAESTCFGGWFGRSQTYLSLIRR